MYLWQYQHMGKLDMINYANGLIFEDKETLKLPSITGKHFEGPIE
jgi:hypothetical protein